jgi:hypothetical protein
MQLDSTIKKVALVTIDRCTGDPIHSLSVQFFERQATRAIPENAFPVPPG